MTMQNPAIGSGQNTTTTAAAAAGRPYTESVRTARNTLDQEAFLQILVSKLQNQDPMAPMEDQDFIAQMAQFSALEQMQRLNSGFSFAQAAGLVGKQIQASLPDPAGGVQLIDGMVTRALMRDGVPLLDVNGREVPYGTSLVVYAPATPASAAPAATAAALVPSAGTEPANADGGIGVNG